MHNPVARLAIGLSLSAFVWGCTTPPASVPFAERTIELEPAHYALDFQVDYEKNRIVGAAKIRLRNRSAQAVDHIPLLLHRLMRVTSMTDDRGRALDPIQRVVAFEDWDRLQVNYVETPLPERLPPGESITVAVAWEGYLTGYTESGMLYVQDSIDREFTILRPDAWAYPEVGYPHSGVNRSAGLPEFDYELSVTVPDDLVVANAGERLGVERSGRKATFRYANIEPSWRIDAAIAPYATIQQNGLTVFHFAEDADGAATLADAFLRAADTFGEWFGPLPETRGFTIVEIPSGFGSQADVTGILQTADAFRSPDRLFELYHEASHLWNVSSTDLPSPRWEEGLAEFLERRLVDHYAGRTSLDEVDRLAQAIRVWLREQFAQDPERAEVPMVDYGRKQMTGYSYRVGMLMFGVLYHRVGPEAFDRLIGEYYRRYHESGASTDEFAALAAEIAGPGTGAVLDDWLYTTRFRRFLDGEWTLSEIAEHYGRGRDTAGSR